MPTKLAQILLNEGIEQKQLFEKIEEVQLTKDPPRAKVSLTIINQMVNGKHNNPHAATLIKIKEGLNALVGTEKYSINDITEGV